VPFSREEKCWRNTHVYVVADEIYEHINFSGTFAALHLSGMLERTITVNGLLKLSP
jgi:aspartate aminotransferase